MDQAQAMFFLANAWLKVKPETINGMLPDLPRKFDNKVTDVSQLNLEADESEMIVCYTTSTTNNEETAEGNIDETEENDNTEQDEQRVDIVECKKRLREAYETILMYEVPLDDLDRKLHRRIRMTLAGSCAELNKSKEQTDLRSYFTNLTKTLAQTIELASDYLAQLGVINLTSDSVRNILKMCTTEEEYENIILSVDVKEVEITESAKNLIQAIKDVKVYSCKNLRNALYANGYKQDHGVISDYDIGLIENLVKHFLDLIESPKNPLNSTILERSAAVQTSIVVTNQLFLAVNDIVELGWLEREYFGTSKTKWDGVLFKTGDHKVSPGFVEFSGGVNDATTPEKERCDVKKLYSMMIDVMNGYPTKVKKQIFCIRFYGNPLLLQLSIHTNSTKIENTMFFEELVVHEEVTFRIQHAAIIVPRTARELVKFTSEIPKLIGWKDAVVKQIEQF
ncbi:hypothetical protein G6F46_006687 [Rhizopus delemar]|nr:hypothetical protein G6F51_011924 [Rhizopus arrhizus]KAG1614784.1 hypothetical protein G6F46_006687 [Rhizopus delemar]